MEERKKNEDDNEKPDYENIKKKYPKNNEEDNEYLNNREIYWYYRTYIGFENIDELYKNTLNFEIIY